MDNDSWTISHSIFLKYQPLIHEVLLFPDLYLPVSDHGYDIDDFTQSMQLGLWLGACYICDKNITDGDEQCATLKQYITQQINELIKEISCFNKILFVLDSHIQIDHDEQVKGFEVLNESNLGYVRQKYKRCCL